MNQVVLDSSAVLALLLEEQGEAIVRDHLDDAILSAVNLQEVVKVLGAMGFASSVIADMLDNLRLDIRPHDQDDAYQAAELAPATRKHGSGLGDRSCLALAIKLGVPALTTDRAWAQLEIPGLQVILAR